jgi:hypothetical protein
LTDRDQFAQSGSQIVTKRFLVRLRDGQNRCPCENELAGPSEHFDAQIMLGCQLARNMRFQAPQVTAVGEPKFADLGSVKGSIELLHFLVAGNIFVAFLLVGKSLCSGAQVGTESAIKTSA